MSASVFRRSLSDFTVRVRDYLAAEGIPPHAFTAAEIAAAFGENLSAHDAASGFAAWYRDNCQE